MVQHFNNNPQREFKKQIEVTEKTQNAQDTPLKYKIITEHHTNTKCPLQHPV